ncbi:carbohydrate-binding protein [Haloferula chungangensis]|uniref:Carbohydrate-binding protein n=1 Tax=Haloferula chungangensis TaxID=1048331 RepID=A0ABW2L657_9BACT
MRKSCLTLLAVFLASVIHVGTAATIQWGSPQTISSAAFDIETDGSLVYAIDAGSSGDGSSSVTLTGKNGIEVEFASYNAVNAESIPGFSSKFRDGANFGTGSSDYGAIVNDGFYHGDNALDAHSAEFTTDTVVLSGLTIGAAYQIQYWAQDADRSPAFQTMVDGAVVLELDSSADNAIDYGQFVVGTFTADATRQSFGVSGWLNGATNYGRAQLNAFQLRAIDNPFGSWRIEAEDRDSQSGTRLESTGDVGGGQNVAYISNGDWLRFDEVVFGENALLNFRVARNSGADDGHIEVRLGSPSGTLIAQIDVPETGGWQTWETLSIPVAPLSGEQDVFLVFVETHTANNGTLFNLNWWSKTAMVEAEDYDNGQDYRFEDTQDIGGGQNLGWISDGEWMEYTIAPETTGWHRLDFRVAGDNSDGSIDIVSNGQTLGSVVIGDTGGWQSWKTVSTWVNFPTSGTQTLRLEFVVPSASFNLNWLSYESTSAPRPLVVGSTPQQQMRYGMDYERLWYWTGGLSGSERDDIARWTAVDADVDFIRVAVNSEYELDEGTYDLSAYTSKIIPLMQEMKQANPKIKFFASPRPLNEAVSNASWQPYPIWITGAPSYSSSSFDFKWQKCAEYLVRYLLLMKSYDFKISFLDVTNEWQSNGFGGRITQDDMDNIHEYLNVTYLAAPWEHPAYPGLTLTADDIPKIVAPSSWNYAQGTQWIENLDSGDREALAIAACHNTDRTGDAQSFADAVTERFDQPGDTVPEIWNTEVHGWKSTSNENETTSFYFYLEAIRAGFGGINGWLAIGTTSQGHSYILNPGGTPTRNVKYYIYRKLSSTSNYGHALDILEEPGADVLNAPLGSNDDDIPRNVAAFIKGKLMTVWVVNENPDPVPLEITPSGNTIASKTVRRTRWTDPNDVEGFETLIPVLTENSFSTTIPGESVCCFEITLAPETFPMQRVEAEEYSHQWGTNTEDHGSYMNLGSIENGDWVRYGSVALAEDSALAFRVARPNGRPEGTIRVREGSADGAILGEVDVPLTGGWQTYQNVVAKLDVEAGIYNLYLEFVENGTTGAAFVNFDWFEIQIQESPENFVGSAVSGSEVMLSWDAVPEAIGYTVKRSMTPGGPYNSVNDSVAGTSFSDTGVAAGTRYYYIVAARFDGFEGDPSVEISVVPSNPIVIEELRMSPPAIAGLNFEFSILNSQLGHHYQLQENEDLEAADWQDIGEIRPGNGGVLDFSAPIDGQDSKHFFRVEVERQ